MNKTYLFVDGTNLYAAQYELFGGNTYLDFTMFISLIEKKLLITFDRIMFYASYSPHPKIPTLNEKKYLKNESFFYKNVKTNSRVAFFTGYRSKYSGKEKEVDVKIAVDIVDFGHRKMFNRIYLLTGDADFMEALHAVKKLKIFTSVICIENKIMFKALLFYHVYIIQFTLKEIIIHKIRKKPIIIRILSKQVQRSI